MIGKTGARMDRLYVIGNGFDLHHHIPSGYGSFAQFVKATDLETYQRAERYLFSDETLWADFENSLAHLDYQALIDDAEEFLVSYAADDWSDDDHHAYQREIDWTVTALSIGLRDLFVRWLHTLTVPLVSPVPLVRLDPKAQFLTFNYTPTLQRLYGIDEHQILHIHGALAGPPDQIVLGHGWRQPVRQRPRDADGEEIPDERDHRRIEGEEHIDRYFMATFKPTKEILSRNTSLFARLSTVEEISVLGHSMSEVDLPYFEALRDAVSPSATWVVTYHRPHERAERAAALHQLGINVARTRLPTLDRL